MDPDTPVIFWSAIQNQTYVFVGVAVFFILYYFMPFIPQLLSVSMIVITSTIQLYQMSDPDDFYYGWTIIQVLLWIIVVLLRVPDPDL